MGTRTCTGPAETMGSGATAKFTLTVVRPASATRTSTYPITAVASVSGQLLDAKKAPLRDGTVLLFPADAAKRFEASPHVLRDCRGVD